MLVDDDNRVKTDPMVLGWLAAVLGRRVVHTDETRRLLTQGDHGAGLHRLGARPRGEAGAPRAPLTRSGATLAVEEEVPCRSAV